VVSTPSRRKLVHSFLGLGRYIDKGSYEALGLPEQTKQHLSNSAVPINLLR
jgi:hypothetical protein